jgi:hypothetical protein
MNENKNKVRTADVEKRTSRSIEREETIAGLTYVQLCSKKLPQIFLSSSDLFPIDRGNYKRHFFNLRKSIV